ncbi:hypothetical protein ACOSQ4_002619 [Xanthoceras sorbifolium]
MAVWVLLLLLFLHGIFLVLMGCMFYKNSSRQDSERTNNNDFDAFNKSNLQRVSKGTNNDNCVLCLEDPNDQTKIKSGVKEEIKIKSVTTHQFGVQKVPPIPHILLSMPQSEYKQVNNYYYYYFYYYFYKFNYETGTAQHQLSRNIK